MKFLAFFLHFLDLSPSVFSWCLLGMHIVLWWGLRKCLIFAATFFFEIFVDLGKYFGDLANFWYFCDFLDLSPSVLFGMHLVLWWGNVFFLPRRNKLDDINLARRWIQLLENLWLKTSRILFHDFYYSDTFIYLVV